MTKGFDRAIAVVWVVIAGSLIGTVALFAVPSVKESAWWVAFSVPALMAAAIAQPFFYQWRSKVKKGVSEFLAGRSWVHWTYGDVEWQTFAEGEWRRTRRRALWMPFAIGAFVFLFGLVFTEYPSGDLLVATSAVFGVAALGSVLALVFGKAALTRRPPTGWEVYIGPGGILLNGSFHTWEVFGVRRGRVSIVEGTPDILQIEIVYSGRGRRTEELRIPIPQGHRAEAGSVVERFGSA